MASIWKHPKSQYWTACYTDSTGRQMKKTTKMKDKTAALTVAENLEAVAQAKRSLQHALTAVEMTARKTPSAQELMEAIMGGNVSCVDQLLSQ